MKSAKLLYSKIKDRTKLSELEFIALAKNNLVLEALAQYLKDEIAQKGKSATTDYEKASWPYYQADRNGEVRALKSILDLME